MIRRDQNCKVVRVDFFRIVFHFTAALRLARPWQIIGAIGFILLPQLAEAQKPAAAPTSPELVDIKSVDPSIIVELRYAGTRNVAATALYPANMPALVRPAVARRLVLAQTFLRTLGYGLKIWDAYRPKAAHARLWELSHKTTFVADPNNEIGSLHTRGAAVDATLIDKNGAELQMPTDFDNFSPAAFIYYRGPDPNIRGNLLLLQRAMARAGFYGLRTEWWHFCAEDWKLYAPVVDAFDGARNAPSSL